MTPEPTADAKFADLTPVRATSYRNWPSAWGGMQSAVVTFFLDRSNDRLYRLKMEPYASGLNLSGVRVPLLYLTEDDLEYLGTLDEIKALDCVFIQGLNGRDEITPSVHL